MKKIIKQLIGEIENLGYSINLVDISKIFYDEPKINSYSLIFKSSENKRMDRIIKKEILGGAGVSFFSRELALLKCISESIERISFMSYDQKNFCYGSYSDFSKKAIDIGQYTKKDLNKINFNWVKGRSFVDETLVYIPAQLIYGNYNLKKEPFLTMQISTGAAGGLDKKSSLLRGVYEVVERDALMTFFLNKIKLPRINPLSIKNKNIQSLIESIIKYNLKIYIFNITNDLEIPTYLTLLIDETGLGPLVRVGYKSNLDCYKAILGSIEESLISRVALRYNNFLHKKPDTKKNSLLGLNYLMNQPLQKLRIQLTKLNNIDLELKYLTNHLFKIGFKSYYVDISLKDFSKWHHYVYKVLIPGLQPYLHGSYKEYRINRLRAVAKYFDIKKVTRTTLPYPFI